MAKRGREILTLAIATKGSSSSPIRVCFLKKARDRDVGDERGVFRFRFYFFSRFTFTFALIGCDMYGFVVRLGLF